MAIQIARRAVNVKGRLGWNPRWTGAVFQLELAYRAFSGAFSMGIIAALVIGAIAGWLAGLIVRGAGFGLIGNIVIGIIGALVASWLLPQLGVSLGGSAVRDIVNATIGAVIVLVILSLVRRA
jgi:uncharacterized membrane protein YeaQ/YmgE (transglycosylase-associated protein family)